MTRPSRTAAESPSSRTIQEEFDRKAENYETDRLSGWYKAQGEIVEGILGEPAPRTILDIGCGTGWLLRQMARKAPHSRGIGIDLSSAMVDVARRKAAAEGLDNLTFARVNWESDGATSLVRELAGGAVHLILAVSSFHYFERPEEALSRMRQCLAPGGVLLVVERDKAGSLLTRAWDLAHRHFIGDQVRFYSADEIIDAASRAGFSDAHVVVQVRRYFWKKKIQSSLAVIRAHTSQAKAST